jgi:hypothetical protein
LFLFYPWVLLLLSSYRAEVEEESCFRRGGATPAVREGLRSRPHYARVACACGGSARLEADRGFLATSTGSNPVAALTARIGDGTSSGFGMARRRKGKQVATELVELAEGARVVGGEA